MRKIILLSLLFTTFCCKPQNKKQIEVEKIIHYNMENKHEYNKLVNKDLEIFDFKKFYEDNVNGLGKTYEMSDGGQIEESAGENGSWFLKNEKQKDSPFTKYKLYYNTGIIKQKGILYQDNCEIGIWYDFDENGKLIKSTDLDEPYKLTIEDILQFLKKNNANFERYYSINRSFDEATKKGTWSLDYFGTYKNKQGNYLIEIDDKTNEIQYVAKITGKEGEKEILKNTKKETLLIDEDNSKKNNNLILIIILFLALAIIVGGFIYISQRSQIPLP